MQKTKKLFSLGLLALCLSLGLHFPVQAADYTNDMKIPGAAKITVNEGAASIDRQLDHQPDPYFAHPDFYHMKGKGSLLLLPHFQTLQQSSEWSCGPAAALMVLNWYGKRDGWSEQKLADLRHSCKDLKVNGFPEGYPGTTMAQMEDIFQKVGGFKTISSTDYARKGKTFGPEDIKRFLQQGRPIMVCWIDWGGHWQDIIGYDDMGTENPQDDVVIMADPYDTTDHNQDGYGIYPAARFFALFDMFGSFPESEGGNHNLFLVAYPDGQ
ncbi:hypothetical protein DW089_00275 [Acidaminococcus sp. AM05-11]|uniref:C39 family peptidase n=1 Tax=Acidaminococcus sp. AM05-11 TaxID=2291997 RepID=UPI000E4AA433|nr:C39 family peptidase [Acidaminococcus sp. AM05-11]RHK03740.1 hypothetical protein DW089_00275 [Acidaminococcus sp. AM05-11]